MADTQSILQLGIEAARAGDKAEARELFRLVTREDPNNAQGWLWLAGVAEDREEKRTALERVLALDPNSDLARKGLAALGGAGAAAGATAAASTASLPTQSAPDMSRAVPPSGPASDQDIADAFDSIDDYAAAPEANRARIYDDSEQVGDYVPPDFGDDDYDLSEYQNKPRVTADDIAAQERANDRVVVVEDEQERRGIGAWLPALIILGVATIALLFFLWNNSRNAQRTANDPNNGALITDTATIGSPAPSDVAAIDPLASPAPVDPLASPAPVDPLASPAPIDPLASAAPVDPLASSAPVDPLASPAPIDPLASPAPVDPLASPAPVDPLASPAPVDPAQPSAPPAAPPASDVASANPAVVGNDQVLQAGPYQYGFSSLSNIATGSYGGSTPSRGRYLIVLATIRNTSDAPQQVPDGFFVVKDAQGRVYDFNRAASVEYFNRWPGSGDYPADAQIGPGAPLGSIPLLFDVAPDATNLVMFSRDNTSQGFLVRQSAQ